ncbi:MAG: chemotaxis protein CheW [Xenococcaceae cyanobacterium MO_188.B32]|nr:chemotaxis protein CheW [Xenococcaceae cyanobacterium MO_188.B32]
MTTSSPAAKIQANLKDLFKADLAPGDAYIRFQLTSDMTALLSREQVQESLLVKAEKITPLPSMPESVIGIMSSRDRVFCVFDLAQLLTLPSRLIAPRQYQILVLQTTAEPQIYIGLAVNRLQGIVRLPMQEIKSSLDAFPSKIATFLCGVVQQEEALIPVLDFKRISEALTTVNHN